MCETSNSLDRTPKGTLEFLSLESPTFGYVSGQGSCQYPSLSNGSVRLPTSSQPTGPFPEEAAGGRMLHNGFSAGHISWANCSCKASAMSSVPATSKCYYCSSAPVTFRHWQLNYSGPPALWAGRSLSCPLSGLRSFLVPLQRGEGEALGWPGWWRTPLEEAGGTQSGVTGTSWVPSSYLSKVLFCSLISL